MNYRGYDRTQWNKWAMKYRETHREILRQRAKKYYWEHRDEQLLKAKHRQTLKRIDKNQIMIEKVRAVVCNEKNGKWSRRESLAMVAGLLIGEGSLNFLVHKDTKTGKTIVQPAICIANCLRSVLEICKNVLKVGYLGKGCRPKNLNRKPIYHYTIKNQEGILKTLLILYPYLFTEKDKTLANLLMEFCTRRLILGRKYYKRDFLIVIATRKINRRKKPNHIDELLANEVKNRSQFLVKQP